MIGVSVATTTSRASARSRCSCRFVVRPPSLGSARVSSRSACTRSASAAARTATAVPSRRRGRAFGSSIPRPSARRSCPPGDRCASVMFMLVDSSTSTTTQVLRVRRTCVATIGSASANRPSRHRRMRSVVRARPEERSRSRRSRRYNRPNRIDNTTAAATSKANGTGVPKTSCRSVSVCASDSFINFVLN